MASDIDQLPFYDPLVKDNSNKMSNSWVSSMSSFLQTLEGYLSQFGMFAPRVTTDERNAIQSPVNGQFIYNTTTDKFQGFEGGIWKDFI